MVYISIAATLTSLKNSILKVQIKFVVLNILQIKIND